MQRAWDSYTFYVASHFLPALINGDWSGMNTDDEYALNQFNKDVQHLMDRQNVLTWHWSTDADDEGDNFRHCEVTGLKAMCSKLTLNFSFEE